ncbi:MAG: hypothetical protein U9N04_04600 [Patescibacteria group bacterium]|nr:hypothetical protein [Patescibacteria group bacterium]
MKQFLKITRTKINIVISFMVLSFIWSKVVLDGIIASNFIFENKECYMEEIAPALFFIFIILEFYIFSCFAIYFVKKKKKIILSFFKLNQFLKPTKTKMKMMLYFFVLSFLFSMLFSIFNRALIVSAISKEKLYFLIQYVLPIPCFILTVLKFYLFACLAVYFVGKIKK